MGQVRQFTDGLKSADLVVGVHDTDDGGPLDDRLPGGGEIDDALPVDGQDGDGAAEAFEELAGLQAWPGARWRVVTMCAPRTQRPNQPPSFWKTAPLRAWLLASVPPPVKMISSGFGAHEGSDLGPGLVDGVHGRSTPKAWVLEGLPKWSRR